jgi:predicted RNA-binding protein (TIGR00451 family)
MSNGVNMLHSPSQKIRSIADYQFGKGTGEVLFPDGVDLTFSRRTGRIRHIQLRGDLLATLRPTDGLFSLTIEGGRRLLLNKPLRLWVKVQDDVEEFIAAGRSVFAKHIVGCDQQIRPEEEVVVVNSQNKLLAVGRALLTGKEMKAFKRGVAVRVRRGVSEDRRKKVKKGSRENNSLG